MYKNIAKLRKLLPKCDLIRNSVSLLQVKDEVILDFWRRTSEWKVNIRKSFSKDYLERRSNWWIIWDINTNNREFKKEKPIVRDKLSILTFNDIRWKN